MALPATGMVRMPFTEQVNLIRNALGTIRQRIPEVERNLEREGRKCHIVRAFTPGCLGNLSHTHCQSRAQGVDSVRHEIPPKQGRNLPGPGVQVP